MTTRAERLLGRMRPADRGPVLSALTPSEIRTVVDLLFDSHRAAARSADLRRARRRPFGSDHLATRAR